MRRSGTVFLTTIGLLLTGRSAHAETPAAGCIGHWVFDPHHIQAQTVKDQVGTNNATIVGPVRFRTDVGVRPMLVDGDLERVTIPYDAKSNPLPTRAVTAEAWICVEKTVEWANIIGIVAGDKGWQLAYRQSSFSFGVSGKATKGLTHVRARDSLEWGRWYHVVGTYDGKTIAIYVNGRCKNTSEAQSGEIDMPTAGSLVIGTFGEHAPRCWLHEIRIFDRALSAEQIAQAYKEKRSLLPHLLRPKVGPVLRRLDKHTITIRWQTDTPEPSVVVYGKTLPVATRVSDAVPKTDHKVTIKDIEPQKMYYYRIERRGKPPSTSRLYEFDATFDFTGPTLKLGPCPYPKDDLTAIYASTASCALKEAGVKRGVCLVLGCGEGRLAYEIARQSEMNVLAIDEDEADVAAARKALDAAGLYGVRVTVQQAPAETLPFGSYLANLIVSDELLATGKLPPSSAEVFRVLRPCGGVAYLGRAKGLSDKGERLDSSKLGAWMKAGSVDGAEIRDDDGVWAVVRRGALPGAGEWTHQYGEPGNSTCSQDQRVVGPMQVLWFGRPGPRPMTDRGTRAPAPLFADGRLFIQGDRMLFGLDAYNGTMLWVLYVPDLRRANIPRDGSNMVATTDALYVTVRDRCWQIEPQTGEIVTTFGLPEQSNIVPLDWGYLACKGDTLYGSAVKRGGLFIGADGEWYDRPDEESYKVVSEYLFALDRKTGKTKWTYRSGPVINPTLAMGDGRLYFIESRSPAATGTKAGRIGEELTSDRYMVSLDAATGEKKWEHYRYFQKSKWVFYLCYANDTLIALDTTDDYHLYGFDAKSGESLWKTSYPFRRNHHGGAMQHPVIVSDVVYAEPRAFKLRSGEPVVITKPANGCGTVSAGANVLLFRDGYHTMYDVKTHQQLKFVGMRPSCWLSLIAAGGMILAPEGSAGCHCAWPVQTTIAFAPKQDLATAAK